MAKLFLSHSSSDNAAAVAVSDWLRANGWDDLFLDFDPRRGIKGGERWEQALNDAASRCEAVIFLVSRAWLASDWCLKEFSLAARLNKRLLGVLIEDIPVTELPVYLTGTWQLIDVAKGLQRESFRVAMPFTGETIDVSLSSEGLVRLREGLRKAGLDPNFFAWPPAGDPGRSPYPGLRPLDADDAGVFFGREAQIIEALDRLRAIGDGNAVPLLCVLGASGSGKSSFLRAGIWPRLERDDRNFLPLPVLRPGRAAITGASGLASTLVAAFASVGAALSREEAETAIRGGITPVRALLERLAESATREDDEGPARPPLLVFPIDQAEELFIADRAGEGAVLLSLLGEWMASGARGLAVVLTIRSDAFERLQTAPQLEGVPLATLTFSPMPRGLYASLIERPAARLRESDRPLVVEPALVRALLDDMEDGGSRDALPLLAFTLERIWLEFGASGKLTLQNYEALGRVRGSIEAAVERAIIAADADPRIPADRDARLGLLRRGLIPWLAGIDPESGSPRRRVARRAEIPDEARPLVDLLVEQRLLSADVDPLTGEATVEPTHEALLRQWGLLDGWLVEDFALLTSLEGVKRAVREWEANAREDAWLAHQGGRLAEAHDLDARADLATMLDGADRAYLAACRAREAAEAEALEQRRRERELEQERRVADARKIARRTGMGLVAALVLAIAAGAFGLVAKQQRTIADQKTVEAQTQTTQAVQSRKIAETEKQRADASAADARHSADIAQTRLREGQRSESAALAERSLEKDAAGDTTSAMELALKALPTDFDKPDRPILARAGYALEKSVWDHRVRFRVQPGTDQVNQAVLDPGGTRIAASGRDGSLHLLDARTGADLWVADLRRPAAFMSAFSPDGTRLATLYEEPASIVVRDVASGTVLQDIAITRFTVGPGQIAFLADGRILYSGGIGDATVRIWDAASGRSTGSLPFVRDISSFTSSVGELDDGRHIYATSVTEVQIWDAASGQTYFSNSPYAEAPADAAAHFVAPAATSYEGLSEVKSLGKSRRLLARSRSMLFVLSEPDRKIERAWSYTDNSVAGLVDAFLVSPGRGYQGRDTVVLPTRPTELGIFDIASGRQTQTLRGHTARILSAAISDNGTLVAASAEDNTIRVWATATGRQLHVFTLPETPRGKPAFLPDGRSLMVAAGRSVYMLDVGNADDKAGSSELPAGWFLKRVDPTGSFAVAADADVYSKTASLIDLGGKRAAVALKVDKLDVNDDRTAFSSDGKLLAVMMSLAVEAGEEGDESRRVLAALTARNAALADGVRSGRDKIVIAVIATDDGRILQTLPAYPGGERRIAFSPDGRYLCHASELPGGRESSHIGVDDVASGRQILSVEQPGGRGECLFGKATVFVVTREGSEAYIRDTAVISSWDLAKGAKVFETKPLVAESDGDIRLVAQGAGVLISNTRHPPIVLDAVTGKVATAFLPPLVGVKDAKLIGSGKVWLARSDNTWAIWDLTSRTAVPGLAGGHHVEFAGSSENGKLALLRTHPSENQSVFRVVETSGGRTLLETAPVNSWIATANLDAAAGRLSMATSDTTIAVHELDHPDRIHEIKVDEPYERFVLCDQGRLLVTVTHKGGFASWDVETGTRVAGVATNATELSIKSPGVPSALVGISAADYGARVLDARSGKTQWQSDGRQVADLAFSGDGTRLVVLYVDEAVVIDVASGRRLGAYSLPSNTYEAVSRAPDGVHAILSGHLGKTLLLDLATGAKLAAMDGVTFFQWGPKSASFVTFVRGSQMTILDFASPDKPTIVDAKTKLERLAVDPSGQILLVACADGAVSIVDARTGKLDPLTRMKRPPTWVAFAGSKDAVLLHETNGTLGDWQVAPAKVLSVFLQPWSNAETFGWRTRTDPGGSLLAVASPDKWVRVYDLSKGQQIYWLFADAPFADVQMPDGSVLAALKASGYLERFDVRQRKTLSAIQLTGTSGSDEWERFAQTPTLMALSRDGAVSVLSDAFNKAVTYANDDKPGSSQAVLSKDGNLLVTVDGSGNLRIWNTNAHALVASWTLAHGRIGSGLGVRLSDDGRRIVVSDRDRDLAVAAMPLEHADLLARARLLLARRDGNGGSQAAGGPRLGIAMRAVTQSDHQPADASKGAFLTEIVPDSPAFQAGLRTGDVIVAVGGTRISNAADVSRSVQTAPAGAALPIDFLRGGQRLSAVAHL